MTMRLTNKGFGAIGILLIIVVVAVIGVGGWAVYHNDHKAKPAVTTKAASNTKQTTSNKKTTTQTTSTSYMDITQWGVKLPLSSPISGLYYVVSTGSQDPDGQPNTMWLGLTSITSTSCTPTPGNANNTAIAAISRATPDTTDAVSGELLTSKYPNGTTLGGYYWTADEGQGGSDTTY